MNICSGCHGYHHFLFPTFIGYVKIFLVVCSVFISLTHHGQVCLIYLLMMWLTYYIHWNTWKGFNFKKMIHLVNIALCNGQSLHFLISVTLTILTFLWKGASLMYLINFYVSPCLHLKPVFQWRISLLYIKMNGSMKYNRFFQY